MYKCPDFDYKPKDLQRRIKLEQRIVKSLISELLTQGFALSVYDGEEHHAITTNRQDVINAIMETDEDVLHVYESTNPLAKHLGFILLVYGNDGWDVMSDWTVALDAYIPKTLALVEKVSL